MKTIQPLNNKVYLLLHSVSYTHLDVYKRQVLFALNEEAAQSEKTTTQLRIILTEISMHQNQMKNGLLMSLNSSMGHIMNISYI